MFLILLSMNSISAWLVTEVRVDTKLMLVQDTAASSHDWAGVAENR